MVEQGKGKLLCTATISGRMPTPSKAVMAALKAEIVDSSVSITLLLPGEVDTPFWHQAGMDTTKTGVG